MKRILRRGLFLAMVTTGLILAGIWADGTLSGWSRLAREYPARADGSRDLVTIEEGGLGEPRWFHRVAPLGVAVGLGGLRLGYPFPYRLAHPPLEIPWTALSLREASIGEEGTGIRLAVRGTVPATISLRGDLASVVREWLAPERPVRR